MPIVTGVANALAWLGRQGTRALAAMVFIGIAVPIGGALKPYVPESIFLLLVLSFLRVEPSAMRAHAARPVMLALLTVWIMVALPGLLCAGFYFSNFGESSPGLLLALVLQAVAPPLMSSPAIAALLGLDAALILLGMVISTAVVPVTAPVFAGIFASGLLSLSPLTLGLKLLGMLAGAVAIATIIRTAAGRDRIARLEPQIDGINVILLFVFVFALMDGVGERLIAQPLLVLGLIALSFGLTFVLLVLTVLVYSRSGTRTAFALGLMASQRNMGLMLAAAGTAVPDMTWLYFALAQFPIYLLPQLVKPLARRINAVHAR